jgi:hypothetical protein
MELVYLQFNNACRSIPGSGSFAGFALRIAPQQRGRRHAVAQPRVPGVVIVAPVPDGAQDRTP